MVPMGPTVCEVDLACNRSEPGFLRLSHADFYGYDVNISRNYTFDQCRDLCFAECDCKAFQYNFDEYVCFSICYAEIRLLNGYLSPDLNGNIYLKLPKSKILSHTNPLEEFSLNCSSKGTLQSTKYYENETVKFLLWFAIGVGGLEIICIFVV